MNFFGVEGHNAREVINDEAPFDWREVACGYGGGNRVEVFIDGLLFARDCGLRAEIGVEACPLELENIGRVLNEFREWLFTLRQEEIAGVFTLRDACDSYIDSRTKSHAQRAVCGFKACGVTIKEQDDFFGVSAKYAGVARGEACAESGDDV